MASSNHSVIATAMKIAQKKAIEHILNIARKIATDCIADMVAKKEYSGFTGQTQTSYCAGIYSDKKLYAVLTQGAWSKAPVYRKLRKGERKFLKNPYEGRPRARTGAVTTNQKSGLETAEDFLKRQSRAMPPKGIGIVVATGTEYSEYLEMSHGLNVLTDTWQVAKKIAMSNITTI